MAKIIYNEKDVSFDFFWHQGEFYDIIQRVLDKTKKKELSILSSNFGSSIILDRRFRMIISQESEDRDLVTVFFNSVEESVRIEFCINMQDKFNDGKFLFSIIPDRIEIESNGDDDKEATISLLCKEGEFLISLIPD